MGGASRSGLITTLLLVLHVSTHAVGRAGEVQSRTFSISGNDFQKDGENFRVISGSVHYWRTRPEEWRSVLESSKRMGVNTITFYIGWWLHETTEGSYDFSSPQLDVVKFVHTIREVGLLAICRVGPYITAEVDWGGFPWWMVNHNLTVRSSDPAYLALVDRWFDQVIPMVASLEYSKGGPIIDWQVEDDPLPYETAYYGYLRDGLRRRGVAGLISTLAAPELDPASNQSYIKDMATPGCWVALEFSDTDSAAESFATLSRILPEGNPWMTMEIYPGWVDLEGKPHTLVPAGEFATVIDKILGLNGTNTSSVSIYMLHGGTNFGFTNGASRQNWDNPPVYRPIITSYDYDAPITEAGDAGAKFEPLRQVFAKYGSAGSAAPPPSPKGSFGTVAMASQAALLEPSALSALDSNPLHAQYPMGMEQAGQGYGWILYEHWLQPPDALHTEGANQQQAAILAVDGLLQDQGLVFLDAEAVGTLGWLGGASWLGEATNLTLPLSAGTKRRGSQALRILVENKGRCTCCLHKTTPPSCARKGIW